MRARAFRKRSSLPAGLDQKAGCGPERQEAVAGGGNRHVAGCNNRRVGTTMRRRTCILTDVRTNVDRTPLSHKHEQLVRTIFRDPVSGNIHWRDVESLLAHLGAHVEPLAGARFRVLLNRAEGILHRPHHSNVLDRQAIWHLREFLARAGVTPSQYDNRS
jgi:hypothetical protein